MKVASFNCKNLKSNHLMVRKLINKIDIVFLAEHWLTSSEKYIINNLVDKNDRVIFESDIEDSLCKRGPGRPHGGRCWLVKAGIEVLAVEQFNNVISMLKIRVKINNRDKNLFIFGVWIPFDNASTERLAAFQTTLALIESYKRYEIDPNDDLLAIVGDFNCDTSRNNRFDAIFKDFIFKNNFFDSISYFNQVSSFTYSNGDYRSTIDHILCNYNLFQRVTNGEILEEDVNLSDHKPICVEIDLEHTFVATENDTASTGDSKKKFHFFDWNNRTFRDSYSKILEKKINEFAISNRIGEQTPDQIDLVYKNLFSTFIKSAREAEKEIKALKNSNKINFRSEYSFGKDREVEDCINKISKLKKICRKSKYTDNVAKMNLKFQKQNLREMQKFYLVKQNRNKSFLLDFLIRENKNSFWKKISKFKRDLNGKNLIISKLGIQEFSEFYGQLFSHSDRPSDLDQMEIEEKVSEFSDRLKNEKYSAHTFSYDEIEGLISKLSLNVSCGNDGILNEFLRYGSSPALITLLSWFFNGMVSTGHVPHDLNISLVTPIPKKSEITTPGDARPISVSSPLANLLESLILTKSPFLYQTSSNQLGYKQNTSCKHAYYLVNETVIYYRNGKSPLHIISLDASKAFDKLWRAGLFYKMIGKMEPCLWRILYNYYSLSKIIVKINDKKSDQIKISEGVKQGGILSPFLFNFFIDDLIRSCVDSGLGARMGRQSLCIVGYCDDLILLSPIVKHAEILLEKCERYAKKWKMEFNVKKSVTMSLGPGFESKSFKINGSELPTVDSFVYLGLPLSKKSDNNNFFEEKFKKVERAFYSLYGLGCKPRHLSPRSIGFIYKQYCQSIIRYGLECLHLPEYKIKEFNIRQNMMLKQAIGLSKFALSTPLLNALKVEKITEVYMKQKLYFYKQIMSNKLTKQVFNCIKEFYPRNKAPKESYLKQLELVNMQIGFSVSLETYKKSLSDLSNIFLCKNKGLVDSVCSLIYKMDTDKKDENIWKIHRDALSVLLYN